jgi:hypothetical protein
MFTYAAVALIAFLACNDTSIPNASSGNDSNPTVYKEGNGAKQPDDPATVIIADDVKEWMEEQLASKSSEKKQVHISDMHIPETIPPGLSATNSNGKEEYFLDGKKISKEEYLRILEENNRNTPCRRNLSIPGEILSGENNCVTWLVLMTAEELAELLSKKYDKLAISFWIEPENE